MLHVLIGDKSTIEKLERAQEQGAALRWTAPKSAVRDDSVVLFLRKAFFGTGKVLSKPVSTTFGQRAAYEADVGEISRFPEPIPLELVAKAVSAWKWTRYPRSYTTVPQEFEAPFLAALQRRAETSPPPLVGSTVIGTTLEALEGAVREARTLSRGRSRALREAALAHAQGICEACGVDFSRVLDGLGLKALQVHHRNQLSATKNPQVTKIDDLAVLCSNCHAMIHVDSQQALPVEDLRERIRADSRHGS